MFIEQPPWIFRALYPKAIFRMSPDEKAVYLTFDDGPIPEVTPWVLELLDKYDIKATFFMVGDNADEYLKNTDLANREMKTDLFRPPHGHMGFKQYHTLKQHYDIIMWDLVTRDYSKKRRPEQVLANVKRYVRNGSIITFHDSLKSWNNGNLQYALPRSIEYLKQQGYAFKVLPARRSSPDDGNNRK